MKKTKKRDGPMTLCGSIFPCVNCANPCDQIKALWNERDNANRLSRVVKFLGKMEKIDRSGQDAGWAFHFMVYDQDKNIPPADVTIAFRGLYDFKAAVVAANRVLDGVEL